MAKILLILFLFSLLSPLAIRFVGLAKTFLLANFVMAGVLFLEFALGYSASGSSLKEYVEWIPSLGVNFEFSFDRLSLVFSSLVVGLGVFIQLFAVMYFKTAGDIRRYVFPISLFFASMLGVLWSDNLGVLFMFWELTSLSSFYLIGFDREKPEARQSAWTALLTTGLGGLSLLGGILVLGQAAGTYRISELISRGAMIDAGALNIASILFLVGIFTKSAQFPFFYWLPGAMSAPAPVSAYLHSATLVKMGVYLAARMAPLFSKTPYWSDSLIGVGLATFVLGALFALGHTPLKKILAYTTVSALGLMLYLIGLKSPAASDAFMVFLVAHALYKAPLFLAAGIIEKSTHQKDIRLIGNLYSQLPTLFWAVLIAGLSLMGFGPVLGFVAKEFIIALKDNISSVQFALFGLGAICSGAVGFRFIYEVFFVRTKNPSAIEDSQKATRLSYVPLAVGVVSLVLAFKSSLLGAWTGVANIHLWHGFNEVFFWSIGFVAFAGVAFVIRKKNAAWSLTDSKTIQGEKVFKYLLNYFLGVGLYLNQNIQSGKLPRYVSVVGVLWFAGLFYFLSSLKQQINYSAFADLQLFEWVIFSCITGAVIYLLRVKSSLSALVVLGVVGYLVALIFGLLGAPDLALTQLSIESLALLIFVLLLPQMPAIKEYQNAFSRTLRVGISLSVGLGMAIVGYAVVSDPAKSLLSSYFRDNSLVLAQGRNVVNVIIVDFRGIDTMGEITVLVIAAIGVSSLIYFRKKGLSQ